MCEQISAASIPPGIWTIAPVSTMIVKCPASQSIRPICKNYQNFAMHFFDKHKRAFIIYEGGGWVKIWKYFHFFRIPPKLSKFFFGLPPPPPSDNKIFPLVQR